MPDIVLFRNVLIKVKFKVGILALMLLAQIPVNGIIIAEHRGDIDPAEAGWVARDSGTSVDEGPVQLGWEPAWMIDDNSRTSGHRRWYDVTFDTATTEFITAHPWRFTGKLRVVEAGSDPGAAVSMGISLTPSHVLDFGLADPDDTAITTYLGRGDYLADNNPGPLLNTFTFESEGGWTAELYINGEATGAINNSGGSSSSRQHVFFGSRDLGGRDNGRGDYALVRLEVFPPVENYLTGSFRSDVGNVQDFTGPTDKWIKPHTSELSFTDRVTLSLWYRADPIPAGERRRLIGKWDGNYATSANGMIILSLVGEPGGERARYELIMQDVVNEKSTIISKGIVRYNEWNNAAIRVIMGHVALFHNGEEAGTGFIQGGEFSDAGYAWGFGADGSGPASQPENFRGRIGEFRHYRAALSDGEIFAITDAAYPRLVNSSPSRDGFINPNPSQVILVFDDPIDPATVNSGTLPIRSAGSGVIAGNYSLLTDRSVEFVPAEPFARGQTFDVEITSGIRSQGGFPVLPESFRFKTWLSPTDEAFIRETRARADSYAGILVDTATGAFAQQVSTLKNTSLRTMAVPVAYNSMRSRNRGALGYGWSHPYEATMERVTEDLFIVNWGPEQRSWYQYDAESEEWRGLDESCMFDDIRPPTEFRRYWDIRKLNGQGYRFAAGSYELMGLFNFKNQLIETDLSDGVLNAIFYDFSDQRIEFTYDPETRLLESINDIDPETGEPFRHVFFEYDDRERLVTIHEPVELKHQSVGEAFVPITMNDGPQGFTQRTIRVDEGETVGFFVFDLGNISHSRVSDLTVSLISPEGTEVVLHNRETGFPNLDFSGMRLGAFNGEDPKGDWRLRIIDHVSGVAGSLNGWTFSFSEASNPVRYSYDGNSARIREARDARGGRIFSVAYDSEGRVVSQDDGVDTNLESTFSYRDLGGGWVETVYTDRTGQPSTFVHDAALRLKSLTNPLGDTITIEHDENGNRTSLTDLLGRTTTFTYTEFGKLASVTEPVPGSPTTEFEYSSFSNRLTRIRDALGKETSFSYDNNNNLRRVEDALGHSDTKSYGGNSQMLDSLMSDGGGVGFTYRNGQLTGAQHMQVSSVEAELAYDGAGRTLIISDAEGNQSRLGYYANDVLRARIDPLGYSEISLIDHRGRIVEEIDKRGNSTEYAFDGNDNLIRSTDALGRVTRYEYDGEDRQVRIISPSGRTLNFEYDALGRVLSQTDERGRGKFFTYDAAGNMTEAHDSFGNLISRSTFNARNQPMTTEDGNGNVTRFEYDILGRQTATIDPQGNRTQIVYDELDRVAEVIDPAGRSFTQTYKPDDLIDEMRTPRGYTAQFRYDEANRLISYGTYNSTHRISRDGRDLIQQEYTQGEDRRMLFKYDELSRLVEKRMSVSGENTFIGYAYDPNGNLTEIGTLAATEAELEPEIFREYDALNRLTTYIDRDGNTLRYEYTEAGELSRLVYPDGKALRYEYDDVGQLVRIIDWAGRNTFFTYNDNGLITLIDFPNGTYRIMGYDTNRQLVERADYTAQGNVIVRYVYSYDGEGNVRSEQVEPLTSPYQPNTVNMTFDRRNRLETYNGVATTFDREGKLLNGPLSGGFVDFSYDGRNNLTQAGNVQYRYDLEDHLRGISVDGQETEFIVNPNPMVSQIIQRTTPQGAETRYIWGIGLLYEETQFGQVRVYHYDARGNTVALSDDTGNVVATIEYSPFGERIRSLGIVDTPFTLSGLFGVVTDDQGLSWMRYRWYNPQIRRFITEDAHFGNILNPESLNRYAYAGNNPISSVDPEGEAPWVLIGAAVGATVSLAVELTTDLIDDGQINNGVGDYVAAALGGAVSGAIITACPTCGALGGGVGAAVGTTLGAVFKGENLASEEFLVGLGVDVAVGAAFGGIGTGRGGVGGAKQLARKAGPSKMSVITPGGRMTIAVPPSKTASVFTPGGVVDIPIPPKLQSKAANKFLPQFKEGLFEARWDFPGGLAQEGAAFVLNQITADAVSSVRNAVLNLAPIRKRPSNTGGNATVLRRAVDNLNRGNTGVYGEFAHWGDYVRFMQVADKPVIQETAQQLRSF